MGTVDTGNDDGEPDVVEHAAELELPKSLHVLVSFVCERKRNL